VRRAAVPKTALSLDISRHKHPRLPPPCGPNLHLALGRGSTRLVPDPKQSTTTREVFERVTRSGTDI